MKKIFCDFCGKELPHSFNGDSLDRDIVIIVKGENQDICYNCESQLIAWTIRRKPPEWLNNVNMEGVEE